MCFYCDYFYQNSGTRYAFRNGGCGNGSICGVFFIALSRNSGAADWSHGAALSFKSSLLFYF